MKADRYLPWTMVKPHTAGFSERVPGHRTPAVARERLDGGCVLYHLPRAVGRAGAAVAAVNPLSPGGEGESP